MFVQVERPQALHPEELDRYLEQGWFRMGQTIFTTSFLNFNNQFYDAVWLRIGLKDYCAGKSFEKLKKRCESFKIVIQPASIDVQKVELYAQYKMSVPFDTSPSLIHLLYGKESYTIYNSYEVVIYDGDRIIAVGIFDLGKHSAAGITSFYDPAYKKYSLGKYLIYLKINYCKQFGLDYFYPGYFVPGYPPFDYKLQIGRSTLQYLEINTGQWLPIQHFSRDKAPLHIMYNKLYELKQQLAETNIISHVFRYEFFDANLIPDLKGAELFDFPVFLYCQNITEDVIQPLVVYDVTINCYCLLHCIGVWTPDEVLENGDDLFSVHVLKIKNEIMNSENTTELTLALRLLHKQNIKIDQ